MLRHYHNLCTFGKLAGTGNVHQKDPVACYRQAPHPFHKHHWCLMGARHAEWKSLSSGSSYPGRRQRLNWVVGSQDTKGCDRNTWAALREVFPVLSHQSGIYSSLYISLTSGMPFIILVGRKEEAINGPRELEVPHSNCCSLPR